MTAAYHFGDLLALARRDRVLQMADEVARAGHGGYRRTDAAVLRLLHARRRSIAQLGDALGVSRQAARKLVTALQRRGYVTTARDGRDARRLNVTLTPDGEAYARAIERAIDALDGRLAATVDRADLQAVDRVLRAALADPAARERAARLVPPPAL